MDDGSASATGEGLRRPPGFLAARWAGAVPLPLLFWRDMALYGTAINLACTLGGVALLGIGGPAWLAVLVHALPIPWNVFLALAVWRSAERHAPRTAWLWQSGAALWLLAAVLV